MVAILGPSGSGKTSLLNVISQRTGLSASSFARGSVKINGRKLKSGDYGKMGAYI
jgi:ABC-type lipoprotein export system ATPase subunit